jgi:hypothetical protein
MFLFSGRTDRRSDMILSMRVCLQIGLPESEIDEIRRMARCEGLSVMDWVRRVLREACARQPVNGTQFKLKAVREAAKYSFPTAEMDRMLDEIERGTQQ